jgi:hypothetical protein
MHGAEGHGGINKGLCVGAQQSEAAGTCWHMPALC